MKNVRIAVIGTNFISDWFCVAAREVDGVEVVAVYSRAQQTGDAFAKKHSVARVYTSLDLMLSDPDINAVYVASPTLMHKEHSIKAMLAGKHVICEKMIAINSQELSEMTATARKMGVVLLEAMRPDFDGSRELIEEQLPRLGKIRRVHLNYCQYSSRYDRFKSGEVLNAFNPALKNSALADIGIYPLHVCIALFGAPLSVSSSSVFLENGFEGAGTVLMSYPDMTATVSYSKIADHVTPSVIEGELGSLTVDKMTAPENVILHLRGKSPEKLTFNARSDNMVFEIKAFCDMINGTADNSPYLDVSIKTLAVVDKVYAASGITFPTDPTADPAP